MGGGGGGFNWVHKGLLAKLPLDIKSEWTTKKEANFNNLPTRFHSQHTVWIDIAELFKHLMEMGTPKIILSQ